MIVVLLVAIVVVVCISGFVKRRSSAPLGGVFLDVSGAHHDTVVGSLQQYRRMDTARTPVPRGSTCSTGRQCTGADGESIAISAEPHPNGASAGLRGKMIP